MDTYDRTAYNGRLGPPMARIARTLERTARTYRSAHATQRYRLRVLLYALDYITPIVLYDSDEVQRLLVNITQEEREFCTLCEVFVCTSPRVAC